MNRKSKFVQNILRTLLSNVTGILASTFIIFFLPKFVTLDEYSNWQLYVFYASYVGFLHFGWTDGFYLTNCGKNIKDLNCYKISANYYSFILFQIFVVLIILLFSYCKYNSELLIYISICLFFTNLRSYSQFLLQATSKFKEYTNIIYIEKSILVLGVMIVTFSSDVSYEKIVFVDLLSRFVALIISSYYCRDILYSNRITSVFSGFSDTGSYIFSGFKLMFSFICGLLIFGVIRYVIEAKWGILTFGQVSFSLSLATLFVVLVNSIGIVFFPTLRNVKEEQQKIIYIKVRSYLLIMLLILLCFYFPLYKITSYWLPDFAKSLIYLSLVFPILLFETKISILTNTYMKVLRKESDLLKVNLFTLVISIILAFVIYKYVDNVEICLLVLVFLSFIRYVISDYIISKIIKVVKVKYWFFDIVFVAFFILTVNTRFYYLYVITILLLLLLFIIHKINEYKK